MIPRNAFISFSGDQGERASVTASPFGGIHTRARNFSLSASVASFVQNHHT